MIFGYLLHMLDLTSKNPSEHWSAQHMKYPKIIMRAPVLFFWLDYGRIQSFQTQFTIPHPQHQDGICVVVMVAMVAINHMKKGANILHTVWSMYYSKCSNMISFEPPFHFFKSFKACS